MSVAVVTDSTAYLPAGFAQRHALRVVPLHVSVQGADSIPEHEFDSGRLTAAWDRKERVTTSGASAGEFATAYREALQSGADGVVSVHLSRRLSGTWDAARLAAREVDPNRIRVVDSRSAAMGLGFAALGAADSARAGAGLSAVESRAALIAQRTRTLFSVQTLEHLRRGGRIGAAAAVLGTALAIKPLLHVHEGRVELLEKVRTTARAHARLLDLVARGAESGSLSVAIHHLDAPEWAERLAEQLRRQASVALDCVVSEVGPVVGAHIGPGALGAVVLPGGWRLAR
ncbi:DegV family protein [Saccharopolyspora sp. 7B]|uniref:DegV family protein n=1 Tax=Saccharopolyspora sp. 7B TaxID=2877240 RepID=UPI001CD4E655|nr:DegV family protein [Saccharopolyspora sp. 7B]MCA1280433.1 DegV family protein [Saccharopolyspora sp. 7B]